MHFIVWCYDAFCLAIFSEDYVLVNREVIFNERTSNVQTVPVTILNDECLEEDVEQFDVFISDVIPSDCVQIVTGRVTLSITDDDSELCATS